MFVRQDVGSWSLMHMFECVASNLLAVTFASQYRQGGFLKKLPLIFSLLGIILCNFPTYPEGKVSRALVGCASYVVPGKRLRGPVILKCDLSRE